MRRQPWLDEEVSLLGTLGQTLDLWRTGFRRFWLTLVVALVVALLVVGGLALRTRRYAPQFVLRVVEAEHHDKSAPPLKRQLAEYVRQGVFTSKPLLDLIQRYGLYPELARENERAALEAFRRDMDVDVYQNYFIEHRAPGGAPRSARLTVSFKAEDPRQALAVTRELGQLVVDHERVARREQALYAATVAERSRERLVTALRSRSADAMGMRRQLSQGEADPRKQVELVALLGSLPGLELQVQAAERRAATLDLDAALERHGAGLRFQLVDDGELPPRGGRVRKLVAAGIGTFVCGLPLMAIAVGAFSRRRGFA